MGFLSLKLLAAKLGLPLLPEPCGSMRKCRWSSSPNASLVRMCCHHSCWWALPTTNIGQGPLSPAAGPCNNFRIFAGTSLRTPVPPTSSTRRASSTGMEPGGAGDAPAAAAEVERADGAAPRPFAAAETPSVGMGAEGIEHCGAAIAAATVPSPAPALASWPLRDSRSTEPPKSKRNSRNGVSTVEPGAARARAMMSPLWISTWSPCALTCTPLTSVPLML
mmetsp:Transcript_7279/g.26406  ORF Transcript_7279/g.26406 Transcript_7279/m.26406 type:complete len:221 (-) Transcript_7279:1646-2308(-)